jgi:hypothetical protein
MVKVEKNGKIQTLNNDVQLAAFIANGWKKVEDKAVKGKEPAK